MSSHPRGTARVAIIDDHMLLADSLSMALEAHGYDVRRVTWPETGGSLASVLAGILRAPPQVVLLDLDLGRFGDGARLIEPLTQAGSRVIVLTATRSKARWGECLRRGALQVLVKTTPMNEVIASVRRVRDGLPLMTREERSELIELSVRELEATRTIRARLDRLTRREQEILQRLMDGFQVRDIARASVVSEATVRTQVKSILAKLETNSQIAAVGAAHRVGWRAASG